LQLVERRDLRAAATQCVLADTEGRHRRRDHGIADAAHPVPKAVVDRLVLEGGADVRDDRLVQDARRDVGAGAAEAAVLRFMDLTGAEEAAFRRALAVLGAQRALRIIGIFARLCLVAGKPGYLAHLPRVWGQLRQNLSHPALNRLAGLCDALLPPPTPETLDRIRLQCPTNPVR